MSVVEGRADIEDLLLESTSTGTRASSDLRGGGWSILWREEDADRLAWFIRKKFGIKSEKPTLGRRPIHVCFREKSGHPISRASGPFLTQAACAAAENAAWKMARTNPTT